MIMDFGKSFSSLIRSTFKLHSDTENPINKEQNSSIFREK